MPFIITLFFVFLPVLAIPLTFGMAIFSKSSKYYYWILFVLGLSMFGLYFRPDSGFDIVRYFLLMENIGKLSYPFQVFSDQFNNSTSLYGSDTNYVFNFFLWFISKLNRPEVLSLVTIVVYYGGIGYVYLKDIGTKSDFRIALFSTVSMLSVPLLYPISVVRFILGIGVSFFITRWYFGNIKKPKIAMLLLFIPMFIHNGLSLLVLSSLIIAIQKKATLLKTIFLGCTGIGIVLLLLSGRIAVNISFLQNIITKFNLYSVTQSQLSWIIINGPGILSLFSVVIFLVVKSTQTHSKFTYYAFSNSIMMSMIYLFVPSLSERYGWAIMPLASWLVYETIKNSKSNILKWSIGITFLCLGFYTGMKIFSQGFVSQVLRLEDGKVWLINFFSYFIFGK